MTIAKFAEISWNKSDHGPWTPPQERTYWLLETEQEAHINQVHLLNKLFTPSYSLPRVYSKILLTFSTANNLDSNSIMVGVILYFLTSQSQGLSQSFWVNSTLALQKINHIPLWVCKSEGMHFHSSLFTFKLKYSRNSEFRKIFPIIL